MFHGEILYIKIVHECHHLSESKNPFNSTGNSILASSPRIAKLFIHQHSSSIYYYCFWVSHWNFHPPWWPAPFRQYIGCSIIKRRNKANPRNDFLCKKKPSENWRDFKRALRDTLTSTPTHSNSNLQHTTNEPIVYAYAKCIHTFRTTIHYRSKLINCVSIGMHYYIWPNNLNVQIANLKNSFDINIISKRKMEWWTNIMTHWNRVSTN